MRRIAKVWAIGLGLAGTARAGDHWPQWRGPFLNGTSDSTGLPVEWSEEKGVRRKVPLPSWSGSTPAVWGDRIFVASASEAGSGPPATQAKTMARLKPEGQDLLLRCLDRRDGKILWRTRLAGGNYQIGKQNMSSPSPVTDGKMVWALTGTGILTGLDLEGKILGQEDLQKKYGKFGLLWGFGTSPLLADGKLYLTSERARTAVAAAGPEFKVLAENALDDDWTLSSIAVAGSELFVRASSRLYCLGKE